MPIQTTARPGTREAHEKAVARVITAMQDGPDAHMSLHDMARVAFMSRYHFNRTFRVVTGVRPRHYLRALRLQAAKRLLVTTSASVTDVCFDVGYNSLGTFIRCFTALLGVSPLRLRSLARRTDATVTVETGQESKEGQTITGQVIAPEGFDGTIFVGLFPSAIPQGAPVACAIASAAGNFGLTRVADGTYYLFALGATRGSGARDLILCDSALRAGAVQVDVKGGVPARRSELTLRNPSPLDPPVLVAIPALMDRYRLRAAAKAAGTPRSVERPDEAPSDDDGARRPRRNRTAVVVPQHLRHTKPGRPHHRDQFAGVEQADALQEGLAGPAESDDLLNVTTVG
jgi:AraC-like DNA-binding protein